MIGGFLLLEVGRCSLMVLACFLDCVSVGQVCLLVWNHFLLFMKLVW